MSKPLAIITGATRGFGLSLAQLALESGYEVIGLGRTAGEYGFKVLQVDLSDIKAVEDSFSRDVFPMLKGRSDVALVNNAGVLDPMGSSFSSDLAGIDRAFRINVTVPLWLMGAFLKHTSDSSKLRIVNVGSGASTSAYPGWMTYCATKAALKMAGDVVGAETKAYPELEGRDIRVMDYAPGVLKTDMQKEIRSMSEEQFPHVARFIELHDEGTLVEPAESAKQALQFMKTGLEDGPAFVAERFS